LRLLEHQLAEQHVIRIRLLPRAGAPRQIATAAVVPSQQRADDRTEQLSPDGRLIGPKHFRAIVCVPLATEKR